MLTFIWVTLGSILGIYILYTLILYIYQDTLIFPKPKPSHLTYKRLASSALQITTTDGTLLQGWKMAGSLPLIESNKIILYFGGNGQDTSHMEANFQALDANTVFTFNYRGYGLSEGKPSEKNLTKDALAIFDFVKNNHPNSDIIVMGHSLGSAIAGYVAKHRKSYKLILLSPLHSVSKVASENFYVLKYFVKHPLQLAETAKSIRVDSLVILAKNDSIIPNRHSLATFENLPSNKQLIMIDHAGHNTLFNSIETTNTINSFINSAITP